MPNPSKPESTPEEIKRAIQLVITTMMDRIMNRVLIERPFLPDKHKADKPLYAALVPNEIFKGSHFERSFVTTFGMCGWEGLAVVAAQHGLGVGRRNERIVGTVKEGRLRRIEEVLNALEHGEKGKKRVTPDWDRELAYILAGDGPAVPVTVVCDVYAESTKTGKRYSFEVKAPLPNSDQTKVSKQKIFKLFSMEPQLVDEAYYALPYNPYGTRDKYSWAFPARWFNMQKDKAVLIGDEFWELMGGLGTYQAFITAINELGKHYRDRIYREYLMIEPPADAEEQGKL